MPSVMSIMEMSGGAKPTLESFVGMLRDLSKPVASEHKPLPIIAPAVMELHEDTYTFEYELGQDSLKDKALGNLIRMKFADITDSYVIVIGIESADNPLDGILLSNEKAYGDRVIPILYRIVDQAGLWGDSSLEGSMSLDSRKAFAVELEALRKEFPTPSYALDERMIRRGSILGFVGWILMVIFILAQTPFSAVIIHFIIQLLNNGG